MSVFLHTPVHKQQANRGYKGKVAKFMHTVTFAKLIRVRAKTMLLRYLVGYGCLAKTKSRRAQQGSMSLITMCILHYNEPLMQQYSRAIDLNQWQDAVHSNSAVIQEC